MWTARGASRSIAFDLEGTGRLEWEAFIRLLMAAGFAGAIGLDRELRAKPAGLRTNMVVGVAAGGFAYAGLNAFPGGDPSRVAAQIVSGIGFLGAGAIFAAGGKPHGLTTAAALWGSAAAGLAAGVGAYATGFALVAVTIVALWPLDRAASSLLAGHRRANVRIAVVIRDLGTASRVRALLGEVGIRVDQLDMRPFGDQAIAMELIVHATRAHLEEAIGRLRLHEEVLFVSEEAVPCDERAGSDSRRQGRDRAHLQAHLGLPSQTDLLRPRRRRRRGASSDNETTGRQRGQQPHAPPSYEPATRNDAGCSRGSTTPRLLELSDEPGETRLSAPTRPASSSTCTSGAIAAPPTAASLASWHGTAPPTRSSLLMAGSRVPDPDPRSWEVDQGNNMNRDRGRSRNDPFSHLLEAGMKRLCEADERAVLEQLTIDLWEPPAGLLLHKKVSLQARIILGGFHVYDIVPRGFQAYARIFHPLQARSAADATPVLVRWTDVVDDSSDHIDSDLRFKRVRATAEHLNLEPLIGTLDHSTAVSLAEVLKRHTKTSEAIYCLFWGGLSEFTKEQQDAIYRAPIDVARSLYPYGLQAYLSPTLWWDAAGEWFVATHPDSSSTYLGGSSRLVRELSTSQRIEAVEVKPQTFVDVVIGGRPNNFRQRK